jgi:hypothetical protein
LELPPAAIAELNAVANGVRAAGPPTN